jgi:hypothetical protein
MLVSLCPEDLERNEDEAAADTEQAAGQPCDAADRRIAARIRDGLRGDVRLRGDFPPRGMRPGGASSRRTPLP